MSDGALSPEDVRRAVAAFEPLTRSLRTLIDVAIRSEVDEPEVRRARRLVEEATAVLSAKLGDGPPGRWPTTDGSVVTWGNAVFGVRNAIAPPVAVQREPDGGAFAEVELGPPYEGPPGQVHGGVAALLLDHVLAATAHRPGLPAVTGTLTLRYLAPTPLGRLRVTARIEQDAPHKTVAAGHIVAADGTVTVRAEGVFIRPGARRAPQAGSERL
ncbi:PaaI family thioesterase [uncultured Mycolicibacterium sp.]|uniref:PaaI family thioesterase n=1 Tax=uncultured Mycolicibacterium sp. TaxID=2320817 RepID=UPI002628C3A6|nr:PaaI family thioesterase [uncultured Mycolicibacterium sp.]